MRPCRASRRCAVLSPTSQRLPGTWASSRPRSPSLALLRALRPREMNEGSWSQSRLQLDHGPMLTVGDRLGEACTRRLSLHGPKTGEPPCLLTPTDQGATERRNVDPKDQLR